MTEDYTNIENKNLSPLFLDALKEITVAGKTLKEKIERVIEIGRNEGIPDITIGGLIRNVLSGVVNSSTIRRYLPDEMKEKKYANVNKEQKLGAQMQQIDDNNVIVESSIEDSKVSNRKIVIEDDSDLRRSSAANRSNDIVESSIKEEEEVAASEEEIVIVNEEQPTALCNHEPYIKDLENQIIELKKQLEIKDIEIAELKKPKIQPSSPNYSLFSSKTHEDYNRNKYRIKK